MSQPLKTPPSRDDHWTEDATWTLVNAWGSRFMELNRGNLRQKDWQSVADKVNSGADDRPIRTDVQCKNRMDTLKRKYKAERARVLECGGASSWPFYGMMDDLIGCLGTGKKQAVEPPVGIPILGYQVGGSSAGKLPQKRPVSEVLGDALIRRNYPGVAATATADLDGEENSKSSSEEVEAATQRDGMTRLALAIEKFTDVYEKIHSIRESQMIEREKQRMKFAKEMEVQRMQLFMDSQVQLQKMKAARRNGSNEAQD